MFDDLDQPTFSYDVDVFAVADYLISLDALRAEPDVTPLKLAKLLYLAQANYLAATGERLFDEDVEAFEHGPVVYREWKRHPGRQIIAAREVSADSDSASPPVDVTAFLDAVWARYKDHSAPALRRLTHGQAPWSDHYNDDWARIVIPDEDMAAYFREHVAVSDRVFHSAVTIVPENLFKDDDADAFAAAVLEYTGP